MKKTLFVTTALAAATVAGAASAEISFGGFGRFALTYDDSQDHAYIEQRFQIDAKGSVEADNGLTFGGKMRARSQDTTNTAADSYMTTTGGFNAAQMFVSAGGLEVQVGNVDYALDSMPNLALGNIGVAQFTSPLTNAPGYSSRGSSDTGVAAIYEMDGLTAHLSYGQTAETTDVYVSYTFNGITGALGYMDSASDLDTEFAASIAAAVGAANMNFGYTSNGDIGDKYALGANMDVASMINVGGYAMYGNLDDSAATDDDFGLGADVTYALGGGAALAGGVWSQFDDKTTTYDLGVSFSF